MTYKLNLALEVLDIKYHESNTHNWSIADYEMKEIIEALPHFETVEADNLTTKIFMTKNIEKTIRN